MLSLAQLAPFVLTVALIELTPGPNMGYLFLVASRSGRAAGMVTVAGVTVGLAAYLALTLAGVAETLQWPWVLQSLRWAGVAYLVWLAWDAWRGAGSAEAETPRERLFLRGLVNNLLNPKAAILYLVLLPSFVLPDQGDPVAQALQLGLIHLTASVAIHCAIVLAADWAGRAVAARELPLRTIERAFAAGLLTVALWIALRP